VTPPKYTGREVIEQHEELLRAEAIFPAGEPLPEVETVDLIAVNDEMRAFLDELLPNKRVSAEYKTQVILRALLDDGLDLRYHNLKTYTAAETFAAREGNCMSFTNLFIALSREAGVMASYQEVKVPPTWSAIGDIHYYYLHINSIVDYRSGKQVVVDFDTRADLSRGRSRAVGDRTAAAQYYNNMAVYYLGEGDLQGAFLNIRKAIDIRPNTGFFWSNLGTILKRAGDFPHAEQAYLAAIDLSGEPAAVSNLARLYKQMGQTELAAIYAERAESFRARNPYYLYELAENAYEEGDYEEANELIKTAIRKRKDEHEFHRLMGMTWLKLGDPEKAERSFQKAAKHATSDDQSSLIAQKLRLLASST
jgi:Flp pilus assembly protein TadD